jgi:hypothetical protein
MEVDPYLNMVEAGWLPMWRLTHYLNIMEAAGYQY